MVGRPGRLAAPAIAAGLGALALLLGACSGTRPDARVLPASSSAPIVYVALGDSTVEGIGATSAETTYVARIFARLRGVYPGARMVNLGVAGATSADVLDGQLARALALTPDLVTLSVGPNDITSRVPVGDFEKNVDRVLDALAGRTHAVVLVNLLPDLAVTPRFRGSPSREAVERLTVEFNDALRRLVRRHGAAVADLYEPSRAEVPQRPELVAGDGYHPSDLGYARWAELMWQALHARIAACGRPGEAGARC